MKLNDLAAIVVKMKGLMPESARYRLAMEIIATITLHLQRKGGTLLVDWQESGAPAYFLKLCELKSGPNWVDCDINIHDSDLATFINRWMNVERIRRSKDGEWEDLNADQNDIRVKMVEELTALWRNQSGDETTTSTSTEDEVRKEK